MEVVRPGKAGAAGDRAMSGLPAEMAQRKVKQ